MFVCTKCQNRYRLDEVRWRCGCGHYLDIESKPDFDINKIDKDNTSIWRYKDVIPLQNKENIVSFGEGFTPLINFNAGSGKVFLKLEQLFPTGSFKDRGASVLISKAKELGIKRVVEDSSGNAGCAVAAYCAMAKIDCEIYVPEKTSPAKLVQIGMYGAKVHRIPGNREDTEDAVIKAADNIYYASHVRNPFFFEGIKTIAYEIWEQLGFKAPDTFITPVGHGSMLIGAYIGFKELFDNKLLKKIPTFIAVQSKSCAPLYKIFKENLTVIPEIKPEPTTAEGIRIAKPLRHKQIIKIIKETGGDVITVTEDEIKEALFETSRKGLFIEPSSAAGIAGLKKCKIPVSTTVLPLTGHGLKAVDKILSLKYS